MKIHTLRDLFIDQLRDLYSAETQIIKALPRMAKAARTEELQRAFEDHLEQSKTHANRLEQIFDSLDVKAGRKKCKGMEGLIEEGKETMSDSSESPVLDAGLIAAAQRVEHYEIAGYGCAQTFAQMLGNQQAAELLKETLSEVKEADKKLTQLAENMINVEAVQTSA